MLRTQQCCVPTAIIFFSDNCRLMRSRLYCINRLFFLKAIAILSTGYFFEDNPRRDTAMLCPLTLKIRTLSTGFAFDEVTDRTGIEEVLH